MKQITRILPEETLLLTLVLIAALLRFYGYSSFSFSNDELSAIVRADQPGFREMIRNGVVPDGHPAGIETLMYFWIKAFGNSEASVRLPFVIMGILSIFPAYFIGKRWFGKVSGLFFASALAFLQFPLLFSQIARPYASGMFLSLSMVLFWTRIVFPQNNDYRHQKANIAAYALFTAACAYNHYFSGLFAIIVGITGFIFMRRERLKPYLISLIISCIIYIPHIKISLHQLSLGGVGEWLAKPEAEWIPQHFFYLLNNSWLLILFMLITLIYSIYQSRKQLSFNKFHYIILSWVLTPLLIGFFYSVYINPVIQHPVLIFSSPFLLLFLASGWNDRWNPASFLFLLSFTLYGVIDTVAVQKYYSQQHFGEFKKIAQKTDEWNTRYGIDQITQVISINNPYYIDLYFKRLNKSYSFAQYDNRGGKDLSELLNIVQRSKTPYFIAAWTKPIPDETNAIIRDYYPCIVEKIDYQGLSGITLFTRKPENGIPCIQDTALFTIVNDFDHPDLWGTDTRYLTHELSSRNQGILLDSTLEFGPTYQTALKDVMKRQFKLIRISLDARILEEGCDAQIVSDLFTPEGKSYAWASGNFNNYLSINHKGKVHFTYFIPKNAKYDDILKVYIWNHGLKRVAIDNFTLQFFNN